MHYPNSPIRIPRLSVFVVLVFSLFCYAGQAQQTITWTNSTGGDWNTPRNWSPNIVPGIGDLAVINLPGTTVSLDAATSISGLILGGATNGSTSFNFNGQTLSLYGTLTVLTNGFCPVGGALVGVTNAVLAGPIEWDSGSLGGTLTLSNNAILTANGTGNLDMNGTVLTNNGTVNWINGHIRTGNGTAVYNNGLWNMESDQSYGYDFGYGSTFNNYGTFRKSGGASEFASYTTISVAFNQLAGVVDVQNGTNGLQVSFQGGGNFTGGYVTTNQYGLTALATGSFNVNGTVTGTNTWQVNVASLAGTNAIRGGFTWEAGVWNNATVTIATNTTVIVNGGAGANMDWSGTIVTNFGKLIWASGHFRTGNGTTLYNYGLWNALDDESYGYDFGYGSTFNNYGTFRKSGGASEFTSYTTINVAFNQLAGVVDVQNGTNGLQVSFQGGGNFTGGYLTTNQYGLTVLAAGSFTVNGTVTGTNTWQDNVASLAGNNVINGALTWVAGVWNSATVTIAANSTVIVNGGGGHYMDLSATIVTNLGTFTWASGHFRTGSGTVFDNYGTWNALDDELYGGDFGYGSTINNYGTFRKSGGASEFVSYTTIGGGVIFNQLAGVVDVQNGTNGLQVSFQGGGNFTGGYLTTNQYGLTVLAAGSFTVNGTVTGTNTWQDNVASLAGNNVINGALTWVAGVWNSATVTIATNSTVIINGGVGDNMDLSSTIVTNLGTFTWASGHFRTGNGTVFDNYGTCNALDDELYGGDFGYGSTVNNYGTFRKTGGNWNGGSGTFTIIGNGVFFNQFAGVIDVQNGTNGLTLALEGGGNLAGGYNTTNSSGLLYLSSGSFNVNGMLTAPNTVENSGNLTGANAVKGTLVWAGGNWDGATVTVATNSTVIINGGVGANMDLSGTTVTNLGTVTWTSGHIRTGNGTAFDNYGTLNAQDDETYGADFSYGSTINNYGAFRKTGGNWNGGSGTYTIIGSGVFFNQFAGVIDVQSGTNGLTLALQGGGDLVGGYNTTNASGFTYLSSGSFNVNGMLTAPNTVENSGNLTGANAIKGTLAWAGGNWDGAVVTIAANSTLIINGGVGVNMDLSGTIVTNLGTVTWTSGHIRTGNSTAFDNYGTLNAQDDESYGADFGYGSTINNYGAFRKTATLGGSSAIGNGVTFTNAGVVDAQIGDIALQGDSFLTTGGRLNFGLNSTTNYGQVSFSGAIALNGVVSANLNGSFIPPAGNSFSLVTYGSADSLFTSTVLPGGLTWSTNYTATAFVLSVVSDLPSGSITNLVAKLQSGSTLLTFTGATNASYTVLASTNLFLARTNWTSLGQASLQGGGVFQYLDSQTPRYPERFYQIVSP